jgi:hypothetical protein
VCGQRCDGGLYNLAVLAEGMDLEETEDPAADAIDGLDDLPPMPEVHLFLPIFSP